MNCKTCNGSTTRKQTSKGVVFECNQDEGDCLNAKGYPTSTWADTGNGARNGGGAARRPVQAADAPPRRSTSTDDAIRWQVCIKGACEVFSGMLDAKGSPTPASYIIALARELYSANPVVAKAAAVLDEASEEEVF